MREHIEKVDVLGWNKSTRCCKILDTKYKKTNLYKVMKEQWQNLIEHLRKYLLNLLQEFKAFFHGTLGRRKTDPVDFELKKKLNQYVFNHIQYWRYMNKCLRNRYNIWLYWEFLKNPQNRALHLLHSPNQNKFSIFSK